MPSLPKKIILDKKARKLYVDSVEFPFYIREDVEVLELSHGFHGIELTLIAEEVEVIE